MRRAQTQSDPSRRLACLLVTPARLFWWGMLLLHVAAIPTLWRSLGGEAGLQLELSALARLVGLSLSTAFFVLKIIDVPCLRMKPGWRSAAIAVLIVALLHVGVVERATAGKIELSAAHPGVVLFVMVAWQFEALRRAVLRLVSALIPNRVRRRRDRLGAGFRGWSWESAAKPLALFFVPSYMGPRAPPVV